MFCNDGNDIYIDRLKVLSSLYWRVKSYIVWWPLGGKTSCGAPWWSSVVSVCGWKCSGRKPVWHAGGETRCPECWEVSSAFSPPTPLPTTPGPLPGQSLLSWWLVESVGIICLHPAAPAHYSKELGSFKLNGVTSWPHLAWYSVLHFCYATSLFFPLLKHTIKFSIWTIPCVTGSLKAFKTK